MVLPDMVIIYRRIVTQCFVIGLKNGEQAVWNSFNINVVIKIPFTVLNRSVRKIIEMFKNILIRLCVYAPELLINIVKFLEIWNSPINFAASRRQNIFG